MKVLVTVGSRHGASEEIGQSIGRELMAAGFEIAVQAPEEVASLDGIDAVIVGSAVYAGRWEETAKRFVGRHEGDLQRLPVWAFSSGPLGDPPNPKEEPPDGLDVAKRIGAREHRVFAGRLERDQLGFAERAIVKLVKAPYGDFRDWPGIRDWTRSVASALNA